MKAEATTGCAAGGAHAPLRLTSVRTCRLCACTDDHACPGGCAWAFDDVCTSCIGHTPASWEAFRCDPVADEAQPPHLLLIASMGHASAAVALIGEQVAHLQPRKTWRDEAARLLGLTLRELIESDATRDPDTWLAAMNGFVFDSEAADDA